MFSFSSSSNASVALLHGVCVGVGAAEIVWVYRVQQQKNERPFVPSCARERACVSYINTVHMHELQCATATYTCNM